jgi:hypothetical protein
VNPAASAKILEQALGRERCELTVADAAARSGLPLREAGEGLTVLAASYAGHLAATSKGELIYQFPQGLARAEDAAGPLARFAHGAARLALGVGRLVVRAWVSVVLVGYALVFAGVLIAVALRSDDDGPGEIVLVVLRVIGETLFWTFHPFSPLRLDREPSWLRRRGRPAVPFYERVNRAVFGVPMPPPDPRGDDRKALAEIRRQKGRVVPGDLMRVTGAARDQAERQLLRLVVDQAGEIAVSDEAAIVYRFPSLRATASAPGPATTAGPPAVWTERAVVPPLTGNGLGFNLLFGAVNGFNLVASGFALHAGLTFARVGELVASIGAPDGPPPPSGDVPLVLGAIPFAFSLALFALPVVRAVRRRFQARRVARENGRRGILRLLFGKDDRPAGAATTPAPLVERHAPEEVAAAWTAAAGRAPDERELTEAVRSLGGELELDPDGKLVYEFDVVARERAAIQSERTRASSDEASPGAVVFSSAEGA